MKQEDLEPENELSWDNYYTWQDGREPRQIFQKALAKFDSYVGENFKNHAVDLGCGDGTETLALLKAGWSVLAIDAETTAIAYVTKKAGPDHRPRLETLLSDFQDLELPQTDLIYAGYSLPFCGPDCFDQLWAKITAALRPGGRFAGQLFGVRDSWANDPVLSIHSYDEVATLFSKAFEIEVLDEIDEDGIALSGPKHWHVFEIVARKRG